MGLILAVNIRHLEVYLLCKPLDPIHYKGNPMKQMDKLENQFLKLYCNWEFNSGLFDVV